MCVRSLGYIVGAFPPVVSTFGNTVGVSSPLVCVRSSGYIVGASPLSVRTFGITVDASLHAA